MSESVSIFDDEQVRAAYWAMHRLPPSPEYLHAIKASGDLVQRRSAKDWPDLSRDERRLSDRYDRIIAAHDAQVLEAYREDVHDAKAAPTTTTGARP